MISPPLSPTRLQHVFTWIVFSCVCCAFILQHFIDKGDGKGKTPALEQRPSLQLLMQARVVVGFNALGKPIPGFGAIPKNFDDVIRFQVKTDIDRLCLVPLFAEIYDRDRAVTELNAIELPAEHPQEFHRMAQGLRIVYESDGELRDPTAVELKKHMTWFGDLAVSHAVGHTQEYRAIIRSVKGVALAQIGAGVAVVLGVIVGISLIIFVVVWTIIGRWRNEYDPKPPGISLNRLPFLELTAVGIAAMLVVPAFCVGILALLRIKLPIYLSFLAILPVFFVFAWPVVRHFTRKDAAKILGFTCGRGVIKEILCGIVGYLAGAPLIILSMLLSKELAKHFDQDPSHPIVERISNGGVVAVASTIVLACIIVPILEEGIFRGALFAYLRRYGSVWFAGIISGLIFAAIHPQGWTAIPTLCSIGFVFAMIREWRGSLIAPIVAHGINNGLALGLICILLLG